MVDEILISKQLLMYDVYKSQNFSKLFHIIYDHNITLFHQLFLCVDFVLLIFIVL